MTRKGKVILPKGRFSQSIILDPLKRELESVARELILFYVWSRIYLLRFGCLERRKVRFFSPSCVQESVLPPWIFLAFYFLVRK